ncbi:MAG TPA: hypothetical protein VFW07_24095 [Parafilimonas sp.]|nr:hypothetical protein [Parafilimonas sp.]
MRNRKPVYLALLILLSACNSTSENTESNEDSIVFTTKKIPAKRGNVNPQPVKIYEETVKSFETTDEFEVRLYETEQTFKYLVKISYKNLQAEDTLKVPNFGMEPAVEIVKGEKRPSCIVGFLDKNKQFKESKLIYFENDKLKVHVLKYYGVYADTAK